MQKIFPNSNSLFTSFMAAYTTHHSSSFRHYDVFLSFRGGDTRKKFTGHLYHALHGKGVRAFMDNEQLRTREEIGPASEQSKLSIPIFYASSKWCIREVVKIVECYKTNCQIVLPIFLDVQPSDVRNQSGSFGEAFRKHDMESKPEVVDEWREALREVGGLKGWDLKEVENEDESKLVQLVVGRVLSALSNTPLIIAQYLIGLETLVEDLFSLISIGSTDLKFVGICGMGGIGKINVVKAIYNKIYNTFEG